MNKEAEEKEEVKTVDELKHGTIQGVIDYEISEIITEQVNEIALICGRVVLDEKTKKKKSFVTFYKVSDLSKPIKEMNVSICDNNLKPATYNIPGTTVCTVTLVNHGLTAGNSRVVLNFTSGTAVSNTYLVQTTPTADTFTVTTAVLTTSGNVDVYTDILIEIDVATATAFYTYIPGEGVLATNGVYVFLPAATVSTTIFYG